MTGLTQITVRVVNRPEFCDSKQIVADLTVNGEVWHWPTHQLIDVGILVDEAEEAHGLINFLKHLTTWIEKQP